MTSCKEKYCHIPYIRLYCPNCCKVVSPDIFICNKGEADKEAVTTSMRFVCIDCKLPIEEPEVKQVIPEEYKQMTLIAKMRL